MRSFRKGKILISGSLSYDKLMFTEEVFADRLELDRSNLNMSFRLNNVINGFGGCAGNICYNLSLLGELPTLLSVVGDDFDKYNKWLKKHGVDISNIKMARGLLASANIITDKNGNQISAFYPSSVSSNINYTDIGKIKDINLAIVSLDVRQRMLNCIEVYKKLKIPYIFDPGKAIFEFSSNELNQSLGGANILISNIHEISHICNVLSIGIDKLRKKVSVLIVTRGSDGSEIYYEDKALKIPIAPAKNVIDPTGAGDAYRAGLIRGILDGKDLFFSCKLGSVISSFVVEEYGTQNHRFTENEAYSRLNMI